MQLHIRWQLTDVIDVRGKKGNIKKTLDEGHGLAHVKRQRHAACCTDGGAENAYYATLNHEYEHNRSGARPERAQNSNIGLLVRYHHDQGRNHIESRNGDDQ